MRALVVVVVASAGCGRMGFDAAPPLDANGDANGDANDASGARFCSARPITTLFCDDFEGPGAWMPLGTVDGTWQVEAGTLAVTSNAIANGSAMAAKLVDLGISARRVRYAFDVRVETVGTSRPILASLRFDDGVASYHSVNYVYRPPPERGDIEEVEIPYVGTPTYTFFALDTPAPGSWHRVEVAIDLDAPLVTSTLDGTQVLTTAPALTDGGTLRLSLGMTFINGPADAWQFRYDNVVVETF